MSRRCRQVDVFGEGSCTGNPVAVVLDADGLGETSRRFAARALREIRQRRVD
jgi:predicted PhzF superfamily epimerase YddE/YHI9